METCWGTPLRVSPFGICMLLACAVSALPLRAAAATYQFFTIPGATSIFPASMNDTSHVAGWYTMADGTTHAFSRSSSGKLTKFDVGAYSTQPVRINAGGDIAGTFSDVAGIDQGFLRLPNGATTRIQLGTSTQVTDMNASCTMIGIYTVGQTSQAFYRTKNGVSSPFTVPGSTWVYPESINDAGQITGFYFVNGAYDGGVGGFVRSPNGVVSTFLTSQGIVPLAINQAGFIAGWYATSAGSFAAFVRQASGAITYVRLPGELVTQGVSINASGVIAGSYTTTDMANSETPMTATHGFLRTPQGAVTSFDVPGAASTFFTAINTNNVTLGYSQGSGAPEGFLLVPGGLFAP